MALVTQTPARRGRFLVTALLLGLVPVLSCAGRRVPIQPAETTGQRTGAHVEAQRRQLFIAVNVVRRIHGKQPLVSYPALDLAAQRYAELMLRQDFFAHRHRGEGPVERARAAGYRCSFVGENLARNPMTAQRVVELWRQSRGHRRNLFNPTFSQTGIGYASDNDPDDPRIYWVQLYGK